MLFIKRFPWEALCDEGADVALRCNAIERVTSETQVSPPVKCVLAEDALYLSQHRILMRSWRRNAGSRAIVLAFAKVCEAMAETGFVHGDISLRNVMFDGDRLWLVDFEPSFRQVRHGRRVMLSAVPRMWLSSAVGGQPSRESDKLGFYLALRALQGFPSSLIDAGRISSREKWRALLPMVESTLLTFNYTAIAEAAFDNRESWLLAG